MKGIIQMSNTDNSEKTTYTRLAVLLIVIGLLIALELYTNISIIHNLWPVITIFLGIGLIGIFVKRKTSGMLYLASGEYLICFSGLALYCNFTSWQNVAQFWPLFIGFLGIVFLTLYFLNKQKRVLLFLGLVLVSLSFFFYFVFTLDVRYWWTIFVLVGLSILVTERIK
jgi:hypothetical protein